MNIEDHIRKAIEEGKFKDLPGQGKPLKLDENPFEDPEWRMANKMLKDGGFSLPWIELRQEIGTDIQAARKALHTAWNVYMEAEAPRIEKTRQRQEWERAQNRFREQAAAINKKIFSYNIQAPSMNLQLFPFNPEKELETLRKPKGEPGHQG